MTYHNQTAVASDIKYCFSLTSGLWLPTGKEKKQNKFEDIRYPLFFKSTVWLGNSPKRTLGDSKKPPRVNAYYRDSLEVSHCN